MILVIILVVIMILCLALLIYGAASLNPDNKNKDDSI